MQEKLNVGWPRVNVAYMKDGVPLWLRLRVPDELPKMWLRLVSNYVSVLTLAYESNPPKDAILRVKEREGFVEFTFKQAKGRLLLRPTLPIHEMARMYIKLSRHQMRSMSESRNKGFMQQDLFDPKCRKQIQQNPAASVEAPQPPPEERTVTVFRLPKNRRVNGQVLGRDADSSKRIQAVMQELAATGTARPLRQPPVHWAKLVDALEKDFPNFSGVVQKVIRPHLALTAMGIENRMPATLLVGPPGVGKTFFATSVAEAMGLQSPLFINVASETNGSSLGGSSTFWSNSAPGRLFEGLAWGKGNADAVANPLLVVDEIDKANSERFDPLGALYSIIEVETARKFEDQSLPGLEIDVSNLRVIATSNSLELIPLPLQSRMLVFHISPPSRSQAEAVLQNIYKGLINRLDVRFSEHLPDDVLDAALQLGPREAKTRLGIALACAISQGRDKLNLGDLAMPNCAAVAKRSIGFTVH